jgi:SET domain-containing protein
MSKLTLSVPQKEVALARKKAKARGTSISAMFAEWVRAENPSESVRNKIGPLTRSISGIIDLPKDFDEKEMMAEILAEKYGIKL